MRDEKKDDQTTEQCEPDRERLCIVGIGASAGGLEAIREMLTEARSDSNLAYVVIQHLDPNHESLLAELLARHTALNVRQVSGGEKILAGNVYIIPPGFGLSVTNGVLHLTEFEQPRGLRRPIDDFFESLALDQGRFAACVILSGTGADGSAGLRAIKENGGLCIVQDPRTAKYDGMPTSAQGTGLVDFVRRPGDIVEAIQQFYSHAFIETIDGTLANTVEQYLEDICSVVRNFVGHDFSDYKKSTLIRRVQRRIQVLDLRSAGEYLDHIRSDPHECEILFRELLINVTRFFRDSAHFAALRERVIEPLIRNAGNEDEIRVWVPGCSSGEEAYTIAMMFADEARLQNRSVKIQIFATDIDEQMLRLARDATYPQAALIDIPEGMRDIYTVARDGRFKISARIRDMIRFSVHSIVRDPPFSNIDLLSCRNLLIYFGERLQGLALPIFHYAIKPGGTLFLGPSETVGRYDHAFAPLDQSARIFKRNDTRPEYPLHLRGQSRPVGGGARHAEADSTPSKRLDWGDGGATERVLSTYAPATLRVTTAGEILKATGRLGKYLEYAPGDPDTNRFATSIARPGAREPLSAIIRQVSANKRRTISRGLSARSEFGLQAFDLIAEPLKDGTILLVFRERDRFEAYDDEEFDDLDNMDSHVQSLEDELRNTRVRLHTTVEELETANEELKSSNEEMMSMNEELQSTNEELSTVNDELKGKVDELSRANADLSNFFASTALPLVVVDRKMSIRNFTDAIQSIYPFRNSDRGRPLAEVTSILRRNDEVLETIAEVMDDGDVRHLRVSDRAEERTWSLVITPYRTRDAELDGATLVFTELTDALRLEDALQREGERLRLALDVTSLGVWEFDPSTRVMKLDETACSGLGVESPVLSLEEFLLCFREDARAGIATSMTTLSELGDPVEIVCHLAGDEPRARSIQIVGRRVDGHRTARVLGVLFDVTEEQEAKQIREMMLREMNHRVKNMFSIISGMVRLASRTTDSVEDLVDGIQTRVNALARSHDLTQNAPARQTLTLEQTIRASLEPYSGEAVARIEGPVVPIASQELTALSLLLHEWATNAAKYGVLGPADGHLEVTWRRERGGHVILTWNEIHRQEVEPSDGASGFGSTLVQLSAVQLNGQVSVEYGNHERRMTLTYAPDSWS
ncbi:PAS domain-containing protein [Salipiger thiooxidans]|uniref:chemotaxis protein CheB n=1 Tax=Salipiger thiooxidans TaxID=282683 RepID=UPI001A8C6AAB|nr:chemotaxis protein CheB [Salipiger thiooxidans]MBN8187499.1 PAS domain-containing protein [Salipiger thiooxidans]